MANVRTLRKQSSDGDENVDRGQLILVTGFAIAVVLLALVLLLNTAIYTENIATRSTADDTREAVEIHATVESTAASYIERKNEAIAEDNSAHSRADAESDFVSLRDPHEERSLRQGQLLSIEYLSQTNGTKVTSVDEGQLTASTDPVEIVNATSETRSFQLRLTDLPSESEQTRVLIEDTETVSISEINLYQNGAGEFVVESDGEVCTTSASEPVLDISAGVFSGEECTVQWPAVGTHSISIVNGSATTGELSLVTHESGDTNTTDDRISTSDAIYSINTSVTYVTDQLEYATEIRVAPGEPDV